MKKPASYIVAAAVIGLSAYALWLDRSAFDEFTSGPRQAPTAETVMPKPRPSLPAAKTAESEDNLDQALKDLGSLPQ